MDLGLRDRVCLVTGASRGIGLATARGLAAEGARVVLTARGEDELAAAAAEIGADHLALDVTEAGAAGRLLAHAGRVDVLVNNAGTSAVKALDELTDEDFEAQWQLNVVASLRLMRVCAPAMAERGWGRIVNVASSSGKRPSGTNVAYSVAKAAQLSLSRSFADAYAARGVLVNAVAPGPVASQLWLGEGGLADQQAQAKGISRGEALEAARSRIPLGRLAEEDEIAAVIVFLCSERASNVTGAAWSVDGGSVPVII
ncbi:MAG: family oxidoreductase [Solirubrobacterales bacterium]|jgi:3-oxoacyl-[acyl-carrier protein] reductase|nr:family oxidoreductase [Solirubrobacterales bacterium]